MCQGLTLGSWKWQMVPDHFPVQADGGALHFRDDFKDNQGVYL